MFSASINYSELINYTSLFWGAHNHPRQSSTQGIHMKFHLFRYNQGREWAGLLFHRVKTHEAISFDFTYQCSIFEIASFARAGHKFSKKLDSICNLQNFVFETAQQRAIWRYFPRKSHKGFKNIFAKPDELSTYSDFMYTRRTNVSLVWQNNILSM